MPMTPRERMLATFDRRKPDQVPIMLGWREEVDQAVMKHYGVETYKEVEQILGADINRSVGVKSRHPEWEARINGELDGPYGHIGKTVLRDERTFEDAWGVVQRIGSNGKYLEWVDGPFAKTDDLDSFDWPTEANLVDDPELATRAAEHKQAGYWVKGSGGVHPFKQAWHMRGFENFLCDYIANPEWVEAIYERILAYNIPILQRSAAAGVDQIEYWGDVAMQDRMIVPPDQWRRLDKQAWKRMIEETHQVNPDVKFFFHSDGDIRPIIPDLIEIGFEVLNPLQPECVNPGQLKQQFGDKLVLDGGGSIQRTLPLGTLDDIKAEIDFLMTTCAWNGGYVFRASNVVGYDCPIENVVAYYEYARDWPIDKLDGPPAEVPDPPPCMSIRTDRDRRTVG